MENLFENLGYAIRYERGNFQSGYCVVEDRKVAVINKFYDAEGRINCLLEILATLEVDTAELEEKNAKFFKQVQKLTQKEEPEKSESKT